MTLRVASLEKFTRHVVFPHISSIALFYCNCNFFQTLDQEKIEIDNSFESFQTPISFKKLLLFNCVYIRHPNLIVILRISGSKRGQLADLVTDIFGAKLEKNVIFLAIAKTIFRISRIFKGRDQKCLSLSSLL